MVRTNRKVLAPRRSCSFFSRIRINIQCLYRALYWNSDCRLLEPYNQRAFVPFPSYKPRLDGRKGRNGDAHLPQHLFTITVVCRQQCLHASRRRARVKDLRHRGVKSRSYQQHQKTRLIGPIKTPGLANQPQQRCLHHHVTQQSRPPTRPFWTALLRLQILLKISQME